MEVNIAPVEGNKGRKRIRDENKWKRNIKKRERYSSKRPPNLADITSCRHTKNEKLKCSTLNSQDIRQFHQAFYVKLNKIVQDNFMLKFMKVHVPKRRRRKVGNRAESRAKYHKKIEAVIECPGRMPRRGKM
ncbi:unnamed protein product [Arctia plantaginis]|uniref:Uncharacterized protein n=1 Tax=Arctia plantaginis TaxID=874455 RepID=A0A8S1ADS7_ARCPL|nr:unnamed protein product [Arctia plantaginis]